MIRSARPLSSRRRLHAALLYIRGFACRCIQGDRQEAPTKLCILLLVWSFNALANLLEDSDV